MCAGSGKERRLIHRWTTYSHHGGLIRQTVRENNHAFLFLPHVNV